MLLFVRKEETVPHEMTQNSQFLVCAVTNAWFDRWLVNSCFFGVNIVDSLDVCVTCACICKGETQRSEQHRGCFPLSTFCVLSRFPTLGLLGKSWATLVFYFISWLSWGNWIQVMMSWWCWLAPALFWKPVQHLCIFICEFGLSQQPPSDGKLFCFRWTFSCVRNSMCVCCPTSDCLSVIEMTQNAMNGFSGDFGPRNRDFDHQVISILFYNPPPQINK